jgi:hypothetical protein
MRFTKERTTRRFAGVAHAAVHLAAVALLTVALRVPFSWSWAAVIVGVLGVVVGPLIFGLYLVVADALLGVNTNEVFAGQRIEDHKCFVRMRIDREGRLNLWAIGVDHVCRAWHVDESVTAPGAPMITPSSPIAAHVIDGPVVIERGPV